MRFLILSDSKSTWRRVESDKLIVEDTTWSADVLTRPLIVAAMVFVCWRTWPGMCSSDCLVALEAISETAEMAFESWIVEVAILEEISFAVEYEIMFYQFQLPFWAASLLNWLHIWVTSSVNLVNSSTAALETAMMLWAA